MRGTRQGAADMLVFWIAISFAVIIGLYKLYVIKKGAPDPTPKQIADTIDEFLDGKGGPYDWHDFVTHHSYKNPKLEDIRKECVEIGKKFPTDDKKSWCSEQGKNELLRISERIRDEIKKTIEARKKASGDAKTVSGKTPLGKSPMGKTVAGKSPLGKGPFLKHPMGKSPTVNLKPQVNAPAAGSSIPAAPAPVPAEPNMPLAGCPPTQYLPPAGTTPLVNTSSTPSPTPPGQASPLTPPAVNPTAAPTFNTPQGMKAPTPSPGLPQSVAPVINAQSTPLPAPSSKPAGELPKLNPTAVLPPIPVAAPINPHVAGTAQNPPPA